MPKIQVCKMTKIAKREQKKKKNQPGFAENRYPGVAEHPSKNREKWFIFHWDFMKIDLLNQANC